jgi:F-type H+-transporting ATPase subunit epsilon
MANDFAVNVVTPDGAVWSGRATSVVVPGIDGYFGVWAGHMPLIAGLDVGALWIKTPSEQVITLVAVNGGFVEVNREGVTILAESAELADSIDITRASKAEERARERLAKVFHDVDVSRAEVALKKASNRRKVAETARARPTHMV